MAVIALLALAFGAWYLLRHRKQESSANTTLAPYVDDKAELSAADPVIQVRHGVDFGSGDLFEVSGVMKPTEMGDDDRQELEGGWHGYEVQAAHDPTLISNR